MYEKFIAELRSYSKAIRILSKGYLPITLIIPSKLEAILKQVQIAIAKTNQNCELVLNRLYLYYDMILVMFWYRQSKEFNNTVSSIWSAIHANKINFVSS